MSDAIITFTDDVELGRTMRFESQYPAGLRMTLEEKRELRETPGAIFTWMSLDALLAGEIYGVPVVELEEPLLGLEDVREGFYCYSNTVLHSMQGNGLGRLQKAYWLGLVKASGFNVVYGHARPNGSQALAKKFGGRFIGDFPDWYGTGETYKLYEMRI